MLKLYKNKKQTFECKVEIEGASYDKAKPRLVLMPSNDNRNIFFEGVIEGNTCKVIVTPNLDIPKTGKVMLEVIVDNTTLFQPWETTYEIVVEQAKVQSESIKLTFEPSQPSIKIVEDVQVKDDKNRIIEPTKPQVKIVEDKKEQTKKLFTDGVSPAQQAVVNEFLSTVNTLNKKEKKALLEHISKTYKPTDKAKKWAKNIFIEQNALATKIAMYCFETEQNTKVTK
jgi:hypothetical protein